MWHLGLLYLVSGLAALAAETVWLRWLRLLLGATAPAASATLVAFFTGHALGAAWAARRVRVWRSPLRAWAGLELAAAACALAVPVLLAGVERGLLPLYEALHTSPVALAGVRYAGALLATLPASFCFGATFPAVGAAALGSLRGLGAVGASLYALNTLGAAAGAALAAFVLLERIGVPGTYGLAVGLSAGVGLGALVLSRRPSLPRAAPAAGGPPRRGGREAPPASLDARALLALAAFSGAGALALQVLLVQALALVLNQSVYAFGAVVVVVLLAGAGAAAVVAWLERHERVDPRTLLGVALAGAALAVATFPVWLDRVTGGLAYVGGAGGGLAYLAAAVGTTALAAGPALLLVSGVLPITFALAARGTPTGPGAAFGGAVLGRLVAANTAGAVVGALAAPYGLLAYVGLWPAFAVLAVLYGVVAVAVPDATPRRRLRRDLVLAVGWVVLLLRASPLGVPEVRLAAGERLLHARSTPAGLVAVVERDGQRLIRLDNHYVLGGTAEQVHEERQGHLPLLLHPAPRRVVFVGPATGISAGAALAHGVQQVHLVELVPEVGRAGARFFAAANRGVYADPRARVILDDARNYLRSTRERFDVVVADLFVPWQAGAGSLYTREHFATVRERLAPDGLFCQWLPLYQLSERELRVLLRTFLDVFPRAALFRGDFYGSFPIVAAVGWKGHVPAAETLGRSATRLAAGGESDRWVSDPLGFWALYVAPLAASLPALEDVPRNTDARPRIEFLAARSHAGGRRGKQDALVGLEWVAFAERLAAAAAGSGDPLFPELAGEARRAVAGGAALQAAGALWTAGRPEAAARLLAVAAQRLPARLLAEAPPDPSAAELWFEVP